MKKTINQVLLPSILSTLILFLSSCGGGNQSNPSTSASPQSNTAANPSPSPTATPVVNKLTVQKAILAKKGANGKLVPVPDSKFKRGDDIHLVLINVGTFKKGKDGKNWIDMDMQVKDPKGQVVLTKQSLLGEKGHRVLKNNIAESPYGTVNTTPKVVPGKYEIKLTVYDKVGGGNIVATTSFDLK